MLWVTFPSQKVYVHVSSTTFTHCAPKATKFVEITQNNGHHAVQGHSRSPVFIPIEKAHMRLLI